MHYTYTHVCMCMCVFARVLRVSWGRKNKIMKTKPGREEEKHLLKVERKNCE